MTDMMLLKIFIEACILGTILSLVAKHEADLSYSKVVMVSAINGVASFMLSAFLTPQLGGFVAIPILLLSFYIIKSMCWLSVKKALIVVAIFSLFHIGLGLGAAFLIRDLDRVVNEPMNEVARRNEERQREIIESIGGTYPDRGHPVPSAPQPPAPLPSTPTATRTTPERRPPTPVTPGTAAAVSKDTLSKTLRTKGPDKELTGDWAAARKLLRVDGIMAGSDKSQMALINGKLHRTGDKVSIRYGARQYVWKIKGITKSGLELDPVQ